MFTQAINDAPMIAGDSTGTMLANRYCVVRQLGSGGMGSVWLVEDVRLDNKLFAVKMLPAILVSNRRAYEQVKREALIALKLVHPNIVQFRALEEAVKGGNPFLVMDYIDGQTLDDYLADKGKLTEDETLRVLRPIAAALDYAHTKGVVHRDVKPGNVMITKDGTPYILDFGIAREIKETVTRVTGKFSSGTLMYMSPEQLHGAVPKPAQDVYSFAALAYECLTGAPPFARGQIEYQIDHDEPAPLPPGGSCSCAAAIMAGLAKKPEDRPATCAAVLEGRAAPQGGGTQVGDAGRARSPSEPQPRGGRHDHKGIQLWEGGPYWADTNIGAEKPEDYGFYFWWGDTVGYKREGDAWVASDGSSSDFEFSAGHTPTCGKNMSTLKSEGWIIGGRKSLLGKLFGARGDSVLTTKHDAAQVHWGGEWRMPTKQELQDLCNKCDWTWTTMNGANGYVVCGRGNYASASIFIPCAGFGHGASFGHAGSTGAYWASVPYSDYNDSEAWDFVFNSGSHVASFYYRYYGQPIRPVQGFAK